MAEFYVDINKLQAVLPALEKISEQFFCSNDGRYYKIEKNERNNAKNILNIYAYDR